MAFNPRAICLGDIATKALQKMLGYRCMNASGLVAFSSVTQTATITLAGTKHTGDVITATVNGTAYAYTTLVTDADLAAVATALAAVIDADANVAASATGAVITITASVATVAFTISVAVTGTGATTTAALANTHNSVKELETVNTITYSIDGTVYSKVATTAIALAGQVLPVSSYRWYTVQINAAGTITTVANADNSAWLAPPSDLNVIIGAVKVVTDATHTFTPATTALNAAGITTTYFDLSVVPTAGYPA